jgi:hypothetical protein
MSIKLKKKQCDGPCGQIQFIFKNKDGKRYCRSCSVTIAGVAKKSGKSKPTVRQYPISKRSNKKAAEDRIYSTKRKKFLEENPMCQAHLPGCAGPSCQVHHKKGRIGSLYLDIEYWLAICDYCHKWVTEHSKEAITLELSLSRLTKNNSDNS